MRNSILKYFLMLLILQSCTTSNTRFAIKEFKKSKTLTSYSGMENELQDAYLVLKENGYFNFYQKIWIIISIKQTPDFGTYFRKNDTLFLNWVDADPKKIRSYLSNKCVIDSANESLWFLDEITNKRLWEMGSARNK